jgi:cell wall-associated protease
MFFQKLAILSALVVASAGVAQGQFQPKPARHWFLQDREHDHVPGLSVQRAYEALHGHTGKPVIVAVIDTGVDINHEDLRAAIWVNEDEIAGNGVDDDQNGYVDDMHGWNFLGGKSGSVNDDTYEVTREYARLRKEFDAVDPTQLPKKKKATYKQFLQLKLTWEKELLENKQQYERVRSLLSNLVFSRDTVQHYIKDSITVAALQTITSQNPNVVFAKSFLRSMLLNGDGASLTEQAQSLQEAYEAYKTAVELSLNLDFDPRTQVGDNYQNVSERSYGNNQVKPLPGPMANHGTHVAGIIAANRYNAIGIQGIATHAKIMVLRAVPNGDERDKDIANAIYYAVDNGARIINMSFGKSHSPQKQAVDKAVQYAAQKGVLLVHAAGNEGSDNDFVTNYPSAIYLNKKIAKNWIEVGASGWRVDKNLVGSFSNFGQKTVDVFAPGVDIYSTVVGNRYKYQDGTSMAAPAVTGVAALLMAYFPEFSAFDIKKIILESVERFDATVVEMPGSKDLVAFGQLSKTGGIVNAYKAVQLALKKRELVVGKRGNQ